MHCKMRALPTSFSVVVSNRYMFFDCIYITCSLCLQPRKTLALAAAPPPMLYKPASIYSKLILLTGFLYVDWFVYQWHWHSCFHLCPMEEYKVRLIDILLNTVHWWFAKQEIIVYCWLIREKSCQCVCF